MYLFCALHDMVFAVVEPCISTRGFNKGFFSKCLEVDTWIHMKISGYCSEVFKPSEYSFWAVKFMKTGSAMGITFVRF